MEELLANAEDGIRNLFIRVEAVMLVLGLISLALCLFLNRRNPPDVPALNNRLASRSLRGLEIYGIIQLYLLLLLLAGCSGRFLLEHQKPVARLVIALVVYGAVSLAIYINYRRRQTSFAAGQGLGLGQLKYLVAAPAFYLALIPFLLIIGGLLKHFGYELPLQESSQQFVESSPTERILFAVTAIGAAPLFEELLYRGILFPALLKRTGLAASILLTACLFSIMHFSFLWMLLAFTPLAVLCSLMWPSDKPWQVYLSRALLCILIITAVWFTFVNGIFHSFLSLSVLSAGVSLAYWRTGSLWTSIAMHAIFNAVTIYALNLSA